MISEILRPTLIVKKAICRNNIRRMAEKARSAGVDFRPHFKTHQSVEVGEWFREFDVNKITVSSASMAMRFADAGWNDITIAFPVNLRETSIYNELSSRLKLQLLLDSPGVASHLSDEMNSPVGIYIEIDCGYGRSGVRYDEVERIDEIIKVIKNSKQLKFKGFLTHDGDTYQAEDKPGIIAIHERSLHHLLGLKQRYPGASISVGDTPACSILTDFHGVDEIRPGNFVYYDLMQKLIGSCSYNDIAVSVACPVTGIYPARSEIVIYGGAVHLSKEFLGTKDRYYGLVVQYHKNGWSAPIPDTRLVSISQEHGVISTTSEFLETLNYGDLLGILPVHSCLSANLLQEHTLII